MAPQIRESDSENVSDDALDLDESGTNKSEDFDSEDEDQLESDASESSPQTSRRNTRTPSTRGRGRASRAKRGTTQARVVSRKSAASINTQTSSELSSVVGADAETTSQADELASEYEGEEAEEDLVAVSGRAATVSVRKAPVKLRLKLGAKMGKESPANPALERTRRAGRQSSVTSSAASSSKSIRVQRKRIFEEAESDLENWSDSGSEAVDLSRMTARQRAKEAGEALGDESLLALPSHSKKGKYEGLTEQEIALKRSEDTRKRQNQLAKRLEDEKQETVNRLLKKQSGKRGKRGRQNTAIDEDEDSKLIASFAPAASIPPPSQAMFRHITTIRSGSFRCFMGVPLGKEAAYASSVAPAYPGPRTLPKTRRFGVAA